MCSRVYVTVGCTSVCPIDQQQQQQQWLAGLLLSTMWEGDTDQYLQMHCGHHAAGASTQQQMRLVSS